MSGFRANTRMAPPRWHYLTSSQSRTRSRSARVRGPKPSDWRAVEGQRRSPGLPQQMP